MSKTIVITGVTSGIGKALIEYFVSKDEKVIGISRSQKKLDLLRHELMNNYPNARLELLDCDFSSLEAIKKTATHILHHYPEGIDVLINNAAIVPQKKIITQNGFELQYQVNHLAVILLSLLLKDLIAKNNGRIITTGSDAHKWAKFDENNLQTLKRYLSFKVYARTKLYNLMFTLYCRKSFKHLEIAHYNVHPGRVKTDIGTKETSKLYAIFWRIFTRNGYLPSETVATYAYLVYHNPKPDEPYFHLVVPHSMSIIAQNETYQELLMKKCYQELSSYLEN